MLRDCIGAAFTLPMNDTILAMLKQTSPKQGKIHTNYCYKIQG